MQINDSSSSYNNVDYETLQQCQELFSVFANIDSLRIFMYAEKGIENSTLAIKHLNLTPKRYYSRLKELVDLGVIFKDDDKYVYTPTGQVMARLGISLIDVINNKEKIELILNLTGSKVLSTEERDKVSGLLLENFQIKPFITPIIEGVISTEIEKITSYEILVKRLSEEIITSKTSMYFASTYFDPVVADACVQRMNKGVSVKVMMSKKTMQKKMTKLRMLLSPKSLLSFLEAMKNNPNVNDFYKEADLPFSYIVIDGRKCFFEFPNIIEGEFTIAFYLNDKSLSSKFIGLFNSMWETADAGMLEILNVFKHL